ncbi:MAG: hypothetical protein RLZ92_626 [Pseudomonadota bacterium]|jgi:hypothetical protein
MFRLMLFILLGWVMSFTAVADHGWHYGHHYPRHHYLGDYPPQVIYVRPPVVEYVPTPSYYAPPVYYAQPANGLLGGLVGGAVGYGISQGDPVATGVGALMGVIIGNGGGW